MTIRIDAITNRIATALRITEDTITIVEMWHMLTDEEISIALEVENTIKTEERLRTEITTRDV
tara:strand:+ start:104 stop:292 length:189 start_codon:yes stop_codon:yes gene_type:complete